MSSLPVPRGVEHYPNFGQIFLVKKEGKNEKNEVEMIIKKEIVKKDNDKVKEKIDNNRKKI